MSVAPILTIVRNFHASAGCAECPLDSHSLSLWIKDSAAKYEVTSRAPKIDFSVTLPLMYEANFSEQNNKCFLEKLRDWVCILVTCVIMARPSEVCEYCPTVESVEIPTQRKDWCDDNMPKWIKLGLPHWKGKKNLALWKFYLHRNMVDVRFCPVSHLMLWLNASEIKRGPLFPKIRNGHILVAFRIKSVTIDQRTMNQWVCEKNDSQVHMSYDEFASTTKHLFNLIAELYQMPEYMSVTPYSYRRSACVWGARSGAREFEIRFAGRWDGSSRHFSAYMEEGFNLYNLSLNANELDPLRKLWVWKACNFGETVDSVVNSKKVYDN